MPEYDHSDYSGDSDDESHFLWEVECPFWKIQEFFSDVITNNILDDVQEEVSHEDYSDEENRLIGSLYLCYSEDNLESQSLLAPCELKGNLVFNISNTKPSDKDTKVIPSEMKHMKQTMRHKVRISVKIIEVT